MAYLNPGALRSVPGLESATSANGTARNGATLALNTVEPGTLSALCAGSIDTSSVAATYKWQVSQDGTTFYDFKSQNNVANVATALGTGSTVAHTFVLDCPKSVSGWKYARVVATLAGAATASADVTAVTYKYLQIDDILT